MNESLSVAKQWLAFAKQDLAVAELVRERQPSSLRIACFHAQQAAEKALKGVLIADQTEFPKTHNLGRLLTLLTAADRQVIDVLDVASLTVWAVESRYPGDLEGVDEAEGMSAIDIATRVVESAEGILAKRVPPSSQ